MKRDYVSLQAFVIVFTSWIALRITLWWLNSIRINAKLNAIKKKKTFKFQTIEQLISNEEADRIVSLSLDDLAAEIRSKNISSETVVRLYCNRAQKAHKVLNCLTDQMFDEAIQQAKILDKFLQETGKTKGILHGIPFSVKDNVDIKGRDSTWGLMKRCFLPAKEDAVCIQLLKEQGAIPFVKTNLSQMTFSWESSNPIFGAVNNPWNLKNSPGGSSGGEAALIAAMGSPFGLGTDIGGSVRIPAHFCGISSLKPTVRRVSNIGEWTPFATESLLSTMGPMSRIPQDLTTITEALLHPRVADLDPTIPYKAFDRKLVESKKKMRIGYFTNDGVFKAHRACVRAVEEVTQKLKSQGHEVIPIQVDGVKGNKLFATFMCGDKFQRFEQKLDDEKVDHTVTQMRLLFAYPWLPIPLVVLSYFSSVWAKTRDILTLSLKSPFSAIQLEERQAERIAFRESVAKEWKNQNLDFVICPVNILGALPHGGTDTITPGVSYTSLFNILDFPAGVVPVTLASREDEKQHTRGVQNIVDLGIKLGNLEKSVEGSPIGVQIAALPYQEEACLRGMMMVQEEAAFNAQPQWQ